MTLSSLSSESTQKRETYQEMSLLDTVTATQKYHGMTIHYNHGKESCVMELPDIIDHAARCWTVSLQTSD